MITLLNPKVVYIDIDKIMPSPHQPRKSFDTASLSELCESIKNYGVIQPVTVRKTPSGYELVAGERRIRASRMAGMKKVPAIVQKMRDDTAASVALIENIQRENLSYIEEAESYMVIMSRAGLTQDELAKKLGKSKSCIANKVRILKLSEKVKRALVKNSLSERHAHALLKLDNESKQLQAIEEIVKNNYNVTQTENLIQRMMLAGFEPEKPIRRQVVKDVCIFVNTINQAIEMIQKSGVAAQAQKNEDDEYIEYIIKINK